MTRQQLQDRRLELIKQIDSLKLEVRELEDTIAKLPSKLEHFEMEKVGNKWMLYTPIGVDMKKDSLEELVSQFMDFREYYYKSDTRKRIS